MSEWNDKVIEELRANGGSAPSMGGATLLILHTTGAKSGQERLSPLLYRERGDDLVIFASYAGAPVNPAWFHNLVAHPEVEVALQGGPAVQMRARVATADERARLWPLITADHQNYAEYQTRTERQIPLVLLNPDAA